MYAAELTKIIEKTLLIDLYNIQKLMLLLKANSDYITNECNIDGILSVWNAFLRLMQHWINSCFFFFFKNCLWQLLMSHILCNPFSQQNYLVSNLCGTLASVPFCVLVNFRAVRLEYYDLLWVCFLVLFCVYCSVLSDKAVLHSLSVHIKMWLRFWRTMQTLNYPLYLQTHFSP